MKSTTTKTHKSKPYVRRNIYRTTVAARLAADHAIGRLVRQGFVRVGRPDTNRDETGHTITWTLAHKDGRTGEVFVYHGTTGGDSIRNLGPTRHAVDVTVWRAK